MSQLGDKTALLEETLNSHRFAISLNATNTDILFNTAQVLTALAETVLESGAQANTKFEARQLLEEALDMFATCLASQQQEYAQMQAEIAAAQASGEYQEAWEGERRQNPEGQGDEEMETASTSSESPGDWATVEAPLTLETILETCTAQLSALITLLGLYTPTADLSSIEKRAQDGMETAREKVPALIDLIDQSAPPKSLPEPQTGPTLSIGSGSATEEAVTSPKDDAVLAVANFHASIAEMQYRSRSTTSTAYAQSVEQAFSALMSRTENTTAVDLASINFHSAYADALIELASALADSPHYSDSTPTFSAHFEIQWKALTQAQTLLTQLSSPPCSTTLSASRLADVFLARGDTDLFRFRIASFENAKPAWTKSKPVLLANAGVFYRGARTYAEKAGASGNRSVANAKAVVAEVMKDGTSGSSVVKESWKLTSADMERVLEQMVDEGIIGREVMKGVGNVLR